MALYNYSVNVHSVIAVLCCQMLRFVYGINKDGYYAALRSRCGHYIFVLFLSFFLFFSSPNLSGRRLDVYHTSTHGVALVRI